MSKPIRSTQRQAKVAKALTRVVDHACGNGETTAYLCSLTLPRRFAEDQHQANDVYKRIQSDFCKNVQRRTGETPRYVTVRTERDNRPEYAICLFTRPESRLEQTEAYEEKGRIIADVKARQAGWNADADGPRFTIEPQSISVTSENQDTEMPRLMQHLQGKGTTRQPYQRTVFVSKCH